MQNTEIMSSSTAQAIQNNEYSIFNPGPVCDWQTDGTSSAKLASDKPKICWQFARKTIHCISDPFKNNDIKVTIYREAKSEIKKRLKEVSTRSPASFENTVKLYVWLRLLSILRLVHISQVDMAKMLFAGHEERLKASIDELEQLGLVKLIKEKNNLSGRDYYKYYTYPIEIDIINRSDTTVFTYNNASLKSLENCKRCYFDESWLETDQNKNNDDACSFLTRMMGWYDELEGLKNNDKVAYVSKLNGRCYHPFHQSKKEERHLIRWNNEPIIEAWDANASFYMALCYMLRQEVKKGKVKNKVMVLEETTRLLNLCLDDEFYYAVELYYWVKSGERPSRNYIKILCQKYRTRWRDYFFTTKGVYKNTPWVKELKYIDMYFEEKFPSIRNIILDSEVIMADNPHYLQWMPKRNGGSYFDTNKTRKVSILDRTVTPYELELITNGVCKKLYEEYSIKNISLHDGIYVKTSDIDSCDVIPEMLREILDVPYQPKRQFPPGLPAKPSEEPIGLVVSQQPMYHINLNTPDLTQLRV